MAIQHKGQWCILTLAYQRAQVKGILNELKIADFPETLDPIFYKGYSLVPHILIPTTWRLLLPRREVHVPSVTREGPRQDQNQNETCSKPCPNWLQNQTLLFQVER